MDSCLSEGSVSSVDQGMRTTTVADKHSGKVVGEPYRGKSDVRFDEGTEGTIGGRVC